MFSQPGTAGTSALSQLMPEDCRRRFAGAFRPRPWIYWSDMLGSAGVGWAAFALSVRMPFGSLGYLAATLVTIGALLRAVLFIHELAHIKRGLLVGFEPVWNVVVGLPLLLPSLMYVGSHGDHHRQAVFGTAGDPEYAPLARWSRLRIAGFVVKVVVVPLLLALRWGVAGPVSVLIPPLRCLVVARASTLVINPHYRRSLPSGRDAFRWRFQETAAAVVVWSVVGGWSLGWIPSSWVFQWYLVGAGILVINQVRTLAAHRYANDGAPLDAAGQLLDSVNLAGWPFLTALAAPLGLRYHALHHFLPAVPYHSLGSLHRRLRAELPADSSYHRTQSAGILVTVSALLQRAAHTVSSLSVSEDGVAGGASGATVRPTKRDVGVAARSGQ